MKLVILDGEGTLHAEEAAAVENPDNWRPLPGALEAVAKLNHAGWHVVLATNQPGLGRGVFEVAALNAIHARMHRMLAAVGGRVDAVFYCPHTPDDGCNCRKPASGLFEQIGERFGIELAGTHAVGDAPAHLVAAAGAGCEPHLVLTGMGAAYRERDLPPAFPVNTRVHKDLGAFADYLTASTFGIAPQDDRPAAMP